MSADPRKNRMSIQEYLDGEKIASVKHEYIDGEVYAMAGASRAHVQLAVMITSMLAQHLRGGPCEVLVSDMKVRVEASNAYYYPDVVVSCSPPGPDEMYEERRPRLIIEVLSSSTEGFDRGLKFADYRSIGSLGEYVLVRADGIGVDCFRRGENGVWQLYPYGPGDIVRFESVDFEIPIERLYERVNFEVQEVVGE